jgi:DNA-binding transcriptional LysR family regulator
VKNLAFRSLRAFEAVASTGSFTRAAELLEISQSAVSQQIRQLDQEVGAPMFDTQARPVALTDAGREMLRHARVILAQVRIAEDAVASLDSGLRGQLHLGVVATANYFAPSLLMAFLRRFPDVCVRMTVDSRDNILAMLTDHRIDLAIAGYPPATADIEAEAFARHPHVLVAAADHPLVGVRGVSWETLRNEPFLFREIGSATRQFLEHLLEVNGLQVATSIELQGNETIKQGVMAGMGITFMSAHAVQVEVAARRMAILDVEGMPRMLDWCVLTRRGLPLPLVVNSLRDFLLEQGHAIARCIASPDDLEKQASAAAALAAAA